MSEILILYILNRYDCTIYKISKLLDEFFCAFVKTSIGTISPALNKLEKSGLVEYREKMSDGGMKSKIYSITKEGKNYLTHLLLSWESKNPYHILNEAKIAIICSEILSINELIEFKNNTKNVLELHRIKIERALENEDLTPAQKSTFQITLNETRELINLL